MASRARAGRSGIAQFSRRFSGQRTKRPTLGVSAQDLSGQLGSYFGAPDGQGVLVTDVRAGSAGEKAGLKAGDVITKLDGEPVHNVDELARAIARQARRQYGHTRRHSQG